MNISVQTGGINSCHEFIGKFLPIVSKRYHREAGQQRKLTESPFFFCFLRYSEVLTDEVIIPTRCRDLHLKQFCL